jgi:hypothetical protein
MKRISRGSLGKRSNFLRAGNVGRDGLLKGTVIAVVVEEADSLGEAANWGAD